MICDYTAKLFQYHIWSVTGVSHCGATAWHFKYDHCLWHFIVKLLNPVSFLNCDSTVKLYQYHIWNVTGVSCCDTIEWHFSYDHCLGHFMAKHSTKCHSWTVILQSVILYIISKLVPCLKCDWYQLMTTTEWYFNFRYNYCQWYHSSIMLQIISLSCMHLRLWHFIVKHSTQCHSWTMILQSVILYIISKLVSCLLCDWYQLMTTTEWHLPR
jgi:uncharacterized membrane protein YvlD (DUF360 family)